MIIPTNFCRPRRRSVPGHQTRSDPPDPKRDTKPNILLVVEGIHDVEFLRRISHMLHADDPHTPDLSAMERRGELIFIPSGGGDPRLWADRKSVV